jgi:hypothetical protein
MILIDKVIVISFFFYRPLTFRKWQVSCSNNIVLVRLGLCCSCVMNNIITHNCNVKMLGMSECVSDLVLLAYCRLV